MAKPVGPVGLRPGQLDLRVVRGDEFAIRLEFYSADDTPLDISGWTLGAQMRSAYQGPLIATFEIDQIGLPDNELNLRLSVSDTTPLGEGVYPWDLQRFAGGQIVRTMLSGVTVVSSDVTEAPYV
jgi:hypothetical protein